MKKVFDYEEEQQKEKSKIIFIRIAEECNFKLSDIYDFLKEEEEKEIKDDED